MLVWKRIEHTSDEYNDDPSDPNRVCNIEWAATSGSIVVASLTIIYGDGVNQPFGAITLVDRRSKMGLIAKKSWCKTGYLWRNDFVAADIDIDVEKKIIEDKWNAWLNQAGLKY